MGGSGTNYLESIFQYLQDDHMDKKGSPLPDADDWELVTCRDDTPHQRNGRHNTGRDVVNMNESHSHKIISC